MNVADDCKKTALHAAAYYGETDITIMLLQNGVDVRCVDKMKLTAIGKAAGSASDGYDDDVIFGVEHIHCILHLLCFGAEIDENAIDLDVRIARADQRGLRLLRKRKSNRNELNGKRGEAFYVESRILFHNRSS